MLACPPQFRKTQYHESTQEDPAGRPGASPLLGLLFAGYWYLHGRYFESTERPPATMRAIGSKPPAEWEATATDNQAVKVGHASPGLNREYGQGGGRPRLILHSSRRRRITLPAVEPFIRQAEVKVTGQCRAGPGPAAGAPGQPAQ